MLTADAIEKAVHSGLAHIYPYNRDRINPNSYNLQLGPKVMEVRANDLDAETGIWYMNPELPPVLEDVEVVKRRGKWYWVLQPNRLYLGHTVEEFGSDDLIACIVGRSTYARNGFAFSYDAGFGDLGFKKQ
jgi:dCTP deaminase